MAQIAKAMKRDMAELNRLRELSERRPYGCKCPTLAAKLTGDGCDECNPQPETDQPE